MRETTTETGKNYWKSLTNFTTENSKTKIRHVATSIPEVS